jgi:hypothetical protein
VDGICPSASSRKCKRSSKDIDESTDTYDTIEWLLKNIPNHNGRVGMIGVSQPGFHVAASLMDAHPALKAASPQAPTADYYMGDDDVYHNGAFMLGANFGFYGFFTPRKGEPTVPKQRVGFDFGTPDAYEFFLKMGPLADANKKYLLRNFIFLRAARSGEPQEELYRDYWQQFDDNFWRVEVNQGRLMRPRSDLFMQHFLASRQMIDIPIKHLFVEYKFWIERQHPFSTVKEELATLARQRDDFRRIIEPKKSDPIYTLVTFLDAFDVRTSYPLLLTMLDANIAEEHWESISVTLESYLVRRAVCGLTTKNYNRVFLTLTRNLRRDGVKPENLATLLSAQSGESTEWPSDDTFREAWRSKHVYQTLNNPKVVHILKRLNDTYFGSKMETVSIEGAMTVEHLLPQNWIEHWPLPDGSKGMPWRELWDAARDDPRAAAQRTRNSALQTFGNLTILTQALNSAASNSAWAEEKPELLRHSLLPINQQLHDAEIWDETAIATRSEELFQRALKLWPRS